MITSESSNIDFQRFLNYLDNAIFHNNISILSEQYYQTLLAFIGRL